MSWLILGVSKGERILYTAPDAELHFTDGALEGLKWIGFAIWEMRGGSRRNVQERIRDLVLDAYAAYEANLSHTA